MRPPSFGRGALHGAAGTVAPSQLVGADVHRIDAAVLVAEEHAVAKDKRRRLAAAEAREPPFRLARDPVEHQEAAPQRGQVDRLRVDRRRRGEQGGGAQLVLPHEGAVAGLQADHETVLGAEVEVAVVDRRRELEQVAGGVAPFDVVGRVHGDRRVVARAGRVVAVGQPVSQGELRRRVRRRGRRRGRLGDLLGGERGRLGAVAMVQREHGDARDAADHDDGGDDVDVEQSTAHGTAVYLHLTGAVQDPKGRTDVAGRIS